MTQSDNKKNVAILQKEWHGGRASRGVAGRGKYFYEALVEDEGLCRVGFSTPDVNFVLNFSSSKSGKKILRFKFFLIFFNLLFCCY